MQRRFDSAITHEFAVDPEEETHNEQTKASLQKATASLAADIAVGHSCRSAMSSKTPRAALVPETEELCGREPEVDCLVDAYLRSVGSINDSEKQQEIVLIYGNAGSGKTALAEVLRSRLRCDKAGLFLSGKFELGKCQEPYAVFVSAFTQLVSELTGAKGHSIEGSLLRLIRHIVVETSPKEAQVLTNIIPALKQLFGSGCEKVETSGTDALHQFQLSFCKFCRSIATVAPLVLFFDDLQWADKASLELIQALLLSHSSMVESSGLLVVGGYRDEEIYDRDHEEFSKHATTSTLLQKPPFYFFLRDLTHRSSPLSSSIEVTKIHLSSLTETSTNELVARTLKLPVQSTAQLSRFVHAESKGNPFQSVQCVLTLLEQGTLYYDEGSCQWACNNISLETCDVESLQDRVFLKLANLPKVAQRVLQIAALMADEVDEPALAMVIEDTRLADIAKALESAAREGLIVHVPDRGRYRFSHNNTRQAALSSIHDKEALSFEVGLKLWERLPPLYLDSKIFTVVNLMSGAAKKISDRSQRCKLAALYLEGGLKAYSRVAFADASRFLEAGIELLQGGDYWSNEYTLTLDLFNAAVDASLCNQDFDRLQKLVKEIQENARSLKDKLPAYMAQIVAMGQHESVHEATQVGIDVLQQLGESLPRGTGTMVLVAEVIKTKLALRKRTNESILVMPPMQNEDKIAAMNVMSILLPYTFQASSMLAVVLGTRLSRLCLKHGLHTGFALGLATFAMVLCRNRKAEGYRLGRLALDLVGQSQSQQMIPRMHFYFYGLVHHWRRPLRDSLPPLTQAVQVGEEIGDIEYAMIALRFKCMHALHCGQPLNLVEQMVAEAARRMRCFKQDNILRLTVPMVRFVEKLRRGEMPSEHCSSSDHPHDDQCSNQTSVLYTTYNLEIELAYLMGDYEKVEVIAAKKRELKMEGQALYAFAVSRWKEGLTAVAQARCGIRKRANIKVAKLALKQVKYWAVDAPDNFWSKEQLLETELESLRFAIAESRIKAKYIKAIKGALREQFTHDAALASELLGDFMNRRGKRLESEKYWNRALDLYVEWGAAGKASQMRRRIGKLPHGDKAVE